MRRPYRTARAMPLTDAQKLLNARLSCEFTTDGDEATPAQFKRLMKKLNLARATPAEFLAVVLSVACPTPLAWDSEHRSEDDEYFEVAAMPILAEALTKLEADE